MDINVHWNQRTLKFCRFCLRPFWKWRPFARDFFFGQNILPTLFNIYAKSCGNPFGSFRYKWGKRFWHMYTIKPSYYYYYYSSSSSSRRVIVRPNSQRLMIRSLLSFTGRWLPISRGAMRSWNFQNGRRCHRNREHMSKSFTSLISETAKGVKIGSSVSENLVGQLHGEKKKRKSNNNNNN
jgi:hypothetical protein